jgi:hypothetical protein
MLYNGKSELNYKNFYTVYVYTLFCICIAKNNVMDRLLKRRCFK